MFLSPSLKVLKLPAPKLKDMEEVKGLSLFGIMKTKFFSFILTYIYISSMKNQCYQVMDLFGTNFQGNF
jgi:hypothetical protein